MSATRPLPGSDPPWVLEDFIKAPPLRFVAARSVNVLPCERRSCAGSAGETVAFFSSTILPARRHNLRRAGIVPECRSSEAKVSPPRMASRLRLEDCCDQLPFAHSREVDLSARQSQRRRQHQTRRVPSRSPVHPLETAASASAHGDSVSRRYSSDGQPHPLSSRS